MDGERHRDVSNKENGLRRAARKDGNHNEITQYLQKLGWSVCDTSGLGLGKPDIWVGKPGFCCPLELKDGDKPPSARKLTPLEEKFRANWTGPYVLAISPEDAARQLEALYSRTLYE